MKQHLFSPIPESYKHRDALINKYKRLYRKIASFSWVLTRKKKFFLFQSQSFPDETYFLFSSVKLKTEDQLLNAFKERNKNI